MVNFSATRVRLKTLSTKLFNNDILSVNLSRNSISNYHKMHPEIATKKGVIAPLSKHGFRDFHRDYET